MRVASSSEDGTARSKRRTHVAVPAGRADMVKRHRNGTLTPRFDPPLPTLSVNECTRLSCSVRKRRSLAVAVIAKVKRNRHTTTGALVIAHVQAISCVSARTSALLASELTVRCSSSELLCRSAGQWAGIQVPAQICSIDHRGGARRTMIGRRDQPAGCFAERAGDHARGVERRVDNPDRGSWSELTCLMTLC